MSKNKTKTVVKSTTKTAGTWKRVETSIFQYSTTGVYRAKVDVNGKTMTSPSVKSLKKAKEYRSQYRKMRS